MIYDDPQSAAVTPRPSGAILHEVGLANLALRLLFGLFYLGCGGLVLAAFLSGTFHPFDAPWWIAFVGCLVIGLIFAALVVFPLYCAAKILGQRCEYVFDQSQRQLSARPRWFGVVVRPRRYGFDRFDWVCVRRELSRGLFTSSWKFIVSCEAQAASIRLVCCPNPTRAGKLADAIAAQMALQVQNHCGEPG
jgi:hypothetical protein